MADQCIGNLTLNINGVKKAVEEVNDLLEKVGVGKKINISSKVTAAVREAMKEVTNIIETSQKQITEHAEKAAKAIEGLSKTKMSEDKNLKEAVALWKEYYQLATKAQNARNSGKNNQAAYYQAEADAIKEKAAAMKEEKDVEKELEKVRRSYNASVQAGADKQAAADARERTKAEKELTAQIRERQKQQEARSVQDMRDEQEAYETLVRLHRELNKLDAEATKAIGSGNTANANVYLAREAEIQKMIDTIAKVYPELDKWAQADERVTEAEMKREAAVNSAKQKSEEIDYKNREEAINAYATALVNLYNEQSKLNTALASGKISEGSKEYDVAVEKIGHLEEAVVAAGSKIDAEGIKMANSMTNVVVATDNLVQSEQRLAESAQISPLERLQNAYNVLTTAVKNYTLAKRANNESGMTFWQDEINKQMAVVSAIESSINALNIDAATREKILLIIQQCKTEQDALNKGVVGSTHATGELESQVKGLITRYLSLMAVIRTINNLIKNTVEYVSEYADKMNEIQMITMKTDAEISQLANTYRNLASEMSVSSLEMADAAIYFTRQGLGAEEIEKRLKNVTMYAKAANVEFKDASEIITAVVNSMGLVEEEAEDGRNAAQRVADVFLNIGDNAATSGQEIGEAMQKAAASAGAFGVSMEWLASYIATVSETTRQEARTIGTAFNTIIARLHQIKQTGYNSDDETRVNDIAKALKNIDVVLMDQAGNWRDMEIILQDIAAKWADLDGKTRSYIATTMAGVKQQNVFLALMNDMSKGAEQGSRAFELYDLAINSAGIAEEKYGVYLDSVAASQERLNIAQEQFYALLDENVIKGWYDTLAGIVNYITAATDAVGGLNILIPLITGAVALLVVGVKHLAVSIAEAGTASAWFATVWETHPVLMVITGVALAITALTTVTGLFVDNVKSLSEAFNEANEKIGESQGKLEKYRKAQEDASKMFADFGSKTKLTAQDLDDYNETLSELASVSPVAKHVVDELKSGFIDQEEAARKLNEELERLVANEEKVSMHNLLLRYATYQSDVKNNSDIAKIARGMGSPNLYQDIEDPQRRFRNIVATEYSAGNLSKELTEQIKKSVDSYMKSDMTVDEAWDTVIQDLLYEWFGDMHVPENLSKTLADEVIEEIDYAMSIVGNNMDFADATVLRANLMNAVFGEDGQLDTTEYARFSNVIASWIRNIVSNGKESIIGEMSDLDVAKTIANAFFGEDAIGDLFEVSEEMQEGFSKQFVDSFKQLMQNGFTEQEIKEIYASMPKTYWNEAATVIRDQLETSLKNAFGTDTLGDLIPIFNDAGDLVGFDIDELLWGSIDLKTMKTILDMANEGILTIDNVRTMMYNAHGDVDVFIKSLKEYGETVGFVIEEVDNADDMIPAPKAIKDAVKGFEDAVSELDKMDKVLKKLRAGEHVGIDDMLDIAGTHPELLAVIHDTEAFADALEELRKKAQEAAANDLINFIKGSPEYMVASKYAEFMTENIQTLEAYMLTLDNESEQYKEISRELETIRQKIIENTNAENESDETIGDLADKIKAYRTEVEKIDDVIANGASSKSDTILSVLLSHPEMMQYVDDMDLLAEKLRGVKDEIRMDEKNTIIQYLQESAKFFEASPFADMVDETGQSFKNMLDYMSSLEDGSDEKGVAVTWFYNIVEILYKLNDAAEESEDEFAKLVKEVKATKSEISDLNDIINALSEGKSVGFDDLLDLASAHPEILGVIGDLNKLKAVLEGIRGEKSTGLVESLRKIIMGSEDIKKIAGFDLPGDTLNDAMTGATENTANMISNYVNKMVASFIVATGELESVSKTIIGEWINSIFSDSNIDAINLKVADVTEEMTQTMVQTLTASRDGTHGVKWDQNVVMNIIPVTPDGQILDEDTLNEYISGLLEKSKTIGELLHNDQVDQGGLGILVGAEYADENNWDMSIEKAKSLADLLRALMLAYYGVNEANETWLQTQYRQAELDEKNNWAKSNGYVEQIGELNRALQSGGAEAALQIWNEYDETIRKSMAETYPGLLKAMKEMEEALSDTEDETGKLENATKHMNRELEKSAKYATVKNFKDTYAAIQKLEKGTISATDAYETFNKELDNVVKAGEDITDVEQKMADGTEVTASDVSNLANILGVSAEEIMQDWGGAKQAFDDMVSASGDLQAAFDALNQAAFIRITGVSEADFSNITNGLVAVGDMAEETIKLLEATGQWTLERMELDGEMPVYRDGAIVIENVKGFQDVLKAVGNNPYAGRNTNIKRSGTGTNQKSGGGGGGGGSDRNGMTEVELMLDRMSQINAIQQSQQNFYQAQSKYYSQTGQLQGAIGYNMREIDLLEEQNKVLDGNIERIEYWLEIKRKEIASLKTTDAEYEEVSDDLDKLQKAHQEYTKQLIDNKTSIDSLNDAIEEYRKKIRQMEIDLRKTILSAIEDREAKAKSMFENEIEMENTILDLIKKRYEKERDQIIETTNMKINALQEERDLLDEQLQLRKQQAEEEDKAAKLAEYELQYQRIMADPTRRKEALEIQKKMQDLREEMAWDAAEKEVKAQQDSIDQQITSLEDYIQYIEEYYEDLFEHPTKLIEEMRELIMQSDEEIIEWLKANDEAFGKSTENTQKQMIDGWQQTLDDMRGIIKTYWDEVEEIIAQGDDYIIQFLKDNSKDYAEAGKLQAEAYVDEWMKQLEDLRKAYEEVTTTIAPDYDYIAPNEGSGKSSGGGGGGGGSGGGGTSSHSASVAAAVALNNDLPSSIQENTLNAFHALTKVVEIAFDEKDQKASSANRLKNIVNHAYDGGGYVDYTGLAWVDGTKQNPEYMLNPYQTSLFETMVSALENINKISVTGMPNYGNMQTSGSNPVSVGDININVDNLDTEDDYEEVAEKVMSIIMERIGRTSVVGGLRISRM